MSDSMSDPFAGLPRNHFAAIYADPPWSYRTWSDRGTGRSASQHYSTLSKNDLQLLPVNELAAKNSVLFLWATWPCLEEALGLVDVWGFRYKTAAFDWMKADVSTIDLFPDPKTADMKLGHWTRSNSEPCLLATRGSPTRLSAAERMGIIESARGHSRKPDCVYGRIERLVSGPYLELFARTTRPGWTSWGNEVGKFAQVVNQ
jgi:N6-adenosine-specific RNA methylase IME4